MENKPCHRDCPHLRKGHCEKYNLVLEPIDEETYFKECE